MLASRFHAIRRFLPGGKFTSQLLEIAALFAIVAMIWVPRQADLNRVVTPDEISWFSRAGKFFMAMKQGSYIDTYQKEHPGVTVMWIGAGVYEKFYRQFQIENPDYADRLTLVYFVNGIARQKSLDILVATRKILNLVNTLVLLLAYLYARRIIGTGPALIGFALIAFDPFHMALTRVMHLDGLLADFFLLSVVSYIVYTQERKWPALVVSGLSAGLAWLTKSPAILLVPALGLLALVQIVQKLRREEHTSWKQAVWSEAWPLVVWGLTGVLVFVAAWPAMWVAPFQVLSKMTGMAETYASEGHSSDVFFNGQIIPGDQFGLRYFYFYPLTFLWRTTPLVLAGLLAFVLATIRRIKPLDEPKVRRFCGFLLLASLVFVVVMTLGQKKFDRYIIPVYPPLDILAGLGWAAALLWLKERFPRSLGAVAVGSIAALLIGLQAASGLVLFPDMLAYYNPLLGGGQKAPQVMQIGWGEGIDQAALYLNQKPNAKNLLVSSWYGPGPFSFFFKGTTVDIPASGILTPADWQAIHDSDYVVIYVHQWQRDLPARLLSQLKNQKPEHTIWINGMEYVRIYKHPEIVVDPQ